MIRPLTTDERGAVTRFLVSVREAFPDQDVSGTLFGSRARGEGDAESDVDVLVVVTSDDLPVRRRIFDLAYEVFLQTEVLVSPLVLSREGLAELRQNGRRLAKEIERDGVAV